jgi:hypothetical protein
MALRRTTKSVDQSESVSRVTTKLISSDAFTLSSFGLAGPKDGIPISNLVRDPTASLKLRKERMDSLAAFFPQESN